MHLELVTIPGLGTFTTRLDKISVRGNSRQNAPAYSFAGGDLKDLGGETNGSLDTELLVLGSVDEIARDCNRSQKCNKRVTRKRTLFQVLDVAARQGDTDFVGFGSRDGCTGCVVFFLSFGDVTHLECANESGGD